MRQADAAETAAKYAGIGAGVSAGANLLSNLLFAEGTDSAPGGPAIVGEHGPEAVILPKGAKVIPTMKDGYAMLDYIAKAGKGQPAPVAKKGSEEVSNTAMIAAMNDKLEKVTKYLSRGKR
jgi:hypothetical protein